MKTHIKNLSLLPLLITGLGLMLVGPVTAQTFTTLHDFNGSYGAFPQGELILSSNSLYGTTSQGGSVVQYGTVFKTSTDGTGFTLLTDLVNVETTDPNSLFLSGNTLYGAASQAGLSNHGEIFAINTVSNGNPDKPYDFTVLHSFYGNDGDGPVGALVLSDGTLYGTTAGGGSSSNGTVFKVNTNGTGFETLHSFSGPTVAGIDPPFFGLNAITNTDGAIPLGGLILISNVLYGAAFVGGNSGNGTIFAINTDGTSFKVIHSFNPDSSLNENNDGAHPNGNLVFSGNTLYGAAPGGGSSGNGTVFKVHNDGTGFATVYSFKALSDYIDFPPAGTNNDGANPYSGLILSNDKLYGTTSAGGSSGVGTAFALTTDGMGFTTLHSFTGTDTNGINSDGIFPSGGLALSGSTFYGMTSAGGTWGEGTIFSISLPPQLTITPVATTVVLSWPSNFTGYTLQSTTNLVSPVWTTNSLATVVINGQNTVTNPISGTQRFFRLSQ